MATRIANRTTKPRRAAKRGRNSASRRSGNAKRIVGFVVPLVFAIGIVICLGFLLLTGYRTVTASSFFEAKTYDVRGTNRVSRDEVERIIRSQTERSGVWNANLEAVRAEVEKLPYVKAVAVSRVLPNAVQVRVDERVPRAAIHLNSGDFWVDDDAQILGRVEKNEQRPNFLLNGWDESKTDRAQKENQERVKLYLKLQDDFQKTGVASRVISVSLNDLQDPQATVEDSGASVGIFLGKEDYGKRLQRALDVIAGKGRKYKSVTSHGASVVINEYQDS